MSDFVRKKKEVVVYFNCTNSFSSPNCIMFAATSLQILNYVLLVVFCLS